MGCIRFVHSRRIQAGGAHDVCPQCSAEVLDVLLLATRRSATFRLWLGSSSYGILAAVAALCSSVASDSMVCSWRPSSACSVQQPDQTGTVSNKHRFKEKRSGTAPCMTHSVAPHRNSRLARCRTLESRSGGWTPVLLHRVPEPSGNTECPRTARRIESSRSSMLWPRLWHEVTPL